MKRSALGLTISGCLAVIVDSVFPNRFTSSADTAVIRYLVRLSGSFTGITARPLAPVRTDGENTASALKFCRTLISGFGDSASVCATSSAAISLRASRRRPDITVGVAKLPVGRSTAAESAPSTCSAGGGGGFLTSSGLPRRTSFRKW